MWDLFEGAKDLGGESLLSIFTLGTFLELSAAKQCNHKTQNCLTPIVLFSGVMIGNVIEGHPIEQVEEGSCTL